MTPEFFLSQPQTPKMCDTDDSTSTILTYKILPRAHLPASAVSDQNKRTLEVSQGQEEYYMQSFLFSTLQGEDGKPLESSTK